MTLDKWPPAENDTDPELFKKPERTMRRCRNCGEELDPDDGAYMRGAQHVLDTVYEFLQKTGEPPEGARKIAEIIAKLAGIEVV